MVEIESACLQQTHHLQTFERLTLESHRLTREQTVGQMENRREEHLYAMGVDTREQSRQSLLVKRYLRPLDLGVDHMDSSGIRGKSVIDHVEHTRHVAYSVGHRRVAPERHKHLRHIL